MNRRNFMKSSVGALGFLSGAGGLAGGVSGCATIKPTSGGQLTLDQMLEQGARVMWVAPHPDDESMVGAILAKAGPKLGNPIHFLVLTHGDGGECPFPEGCHPDLGTVRGAELVRVAELYKASLQHEYYWNAPLPADSFPPRHKIAERWVRENGDPTVLIAKSIRDFKPDVLLTFSPIHGFTGHPEHQLTSRFATAAVRLAADGKAELPGQAHRVDHVYFGLNRYWIMRLFGSYDPLPPTEIFRGRQECIDGKLCTDIMAENTLPHKTQNNDMGTVRVISRMIVNLYLHKTDPFTEIYDPFEPVEAGGMT